MRKTFCLLAALLLAAGPAGASGDGAGKNRECAAGMNLMRNQWSGKRVAFLGDSITDERHVGTTKNYWQYLSEMLGIVPFVYGINGHQWSDVLGQARKLYAERGDAVDAVVVFAGTNDFNAGVPLGEWYEVREAECPMPGPSVGTRMRRTPSADTGTLCGRINAVLAFLKEHYPTKQVILLTPLHRGYARFSDRNVQPDESYPNRLGLYADAYVAKIREAGSVWAVPVSTSTASAVFIPSPIRMSVISATGRPTVCIPTPRVTSVWPKPWRISCWRSRPVSTDDTGIRPLSGSGP